MLVSVIIPAFNEEKVIGECLASITDQTIKDFEVIVINDGSTDRTKEIIEKFKVKLLTQKHQGPGIARNLGARIAKGEILVFVDADMVFDKKFLENLIKPILNNKAIGSFSKEELVLNKDNVWSQCWNINKDLPTDRMHPINYPSIQPVFRAILKKEFDKVEGFSPIGYIDDYTLSEKLEIQAVTAPGAIFYHRNPESLREVYTQARWIGKSEYKKRKIKNESLMKVIALIRYSLPFSLFKGIVKALEFKLPEFLIFKLIYDLAVEISLIKSYFREQKYK